LLGESDMNEPDLTAGAPRKILLATDLSARGDRALERAISIARRNHAALIILHVFEELDESSLTYGTRVLPSWHRPPDAVTLMKRRIRQGLRSDLGDAVENAVIVVEAGDPAQVIERVAASEQVDLVVTGIAREGMFASRPVVLGKTVEQLLRRLPVPILIVRDRVRDAYQHIVVATDFSESSGHALQMAVRFFPTQPLYLLHASEVPYSTLVDDSKLHAERYREARVDELRTFLASVFLPDHDRQRLVPSIEPGPPQQIIREYVQMHGGDLVVLGTQGRGAVMEAFLGSTTKSILSTLPCDALVVRGPPR
jgi:nucleotide-binding universal stress UspA family protein